jgi:hypothetical protein
MKDCPLLARGGVHRRERRRRTGRAAKEAPAKESPANSVDELGSSDPPCHFWTLGARVADSLVWSVFAVGSPRREKAPASIAVMALARASSGVNESGLVTNSSIFTLLWPTTISGRPSHRLTLARHLPGCCSKAFTKNSLYSTADPRRVSHLNHTSENWPSKIGLKDYSRGDVLPLQGRLRLQDSGHRLDAVPTPAIAPDRLCGGPPHGDATQTMTSSVKCDL